MAKKKNRKPKKYKGRSSQVEYNYHLPVLLNESIDYLVTDEDGIYIDGTLGGGGHSEALLRRLSVRGKLLAFDKDKEAIEHCSVKFVDELSKGIGSRLVIYNEPFEKACSIQEIRGKTNGFLLDLGLSSRQLDESCRGFSYRANSELDMRFGSLGTTAAEILHAATEEEIDTILRQYGEEPFSRRIARCIVDRRRAQPISSTFDLRLIIEEIVPVKLQIKSLSRVFQALRIAVNDELSTLSNTLSGSLCLLKQGGRIAIISYHSLEDRIVKNFFKEHSVVKMKNFNSNDNTTNNVPKLKILTPKPIVPNDEEIRINFRARSAKLRVAELA